MEIIKLAIVTEDKEYGRALSLALVEIHKNFTVTLYGSEQIHKTSGQNFDLVLTDYTAETDGRIRLVEKLSMAVFDREKKVFRLYKYNNVRELAGELLLIYSLLTGRSAIPIRNEDLRLVLFGAAEGGVGCTSAAMAFAQELKRFHNQKVLYLSLEEIESTLEYMEAFPGGKSIGEYLYYLFDQKEGVDLPFLESFLIFDYYGVDAFSPSTGRNLLNTLEPAETEYFISTLINMGRYDYIVVDAGCALGKSALCCYEMANNICIVAKPEPCNYKADRLIEYLMYLKGEKIADRMGKVAVGAINEEQPAGEPEAPLIKTVCALPFDTATFHTENNIKTISLDGAYGQGIKELARSITRRGSI